MPADYGAHSKPPEECGKWVSGHKCVLDKGHPGNCMPQALIDKEATEAVRHFQDTEWQRLQTKARGGPPLESVDDLLKDIEEHGA